ncbi:MAG: nucleotidyltransferase domain-containing protein [Rhodospirillaceae bacterium]|nr:nucleotidyltransferase domain-containing protein [Rhodospirillaceae bacterium]MCA8933368.1 nucleotidyltransferase domain-containing protein [Rhodospirillaceae bacterium]
MSIGELTRLDTVVQVLRAHEAALQRDGVRHVDVFGSLARGSADVRSDVDLCVELDPAARAKGFAQVGQIEDLRAQLRAIVGAPVDLVVAPVSKPDLRRHIDEDAVRAF